MTEPRSIEPQFNPCERHPDCLFQGGCECKRQQMRERRTVPQIDPPCPATRPAPGIAPIPCALPLGHAGEHRSKGGTSWGRAIEPQFDSVDTYDWVIVRIDRVPISTAPTAEEAQAIARRLEEMHLGVDFSVVHRSFPLRGRPSDGN